MTDRAVLFIDGNNWYHSLRDLGLTGLGQLDYAAISRKLVGPREWIGTRYYIGQVQQRGNLALYAAQRRFLAYLQSLDHRISIHLGRLERRIVQNEAAAELRQYLSTMPVRIDSNVFHDLMSLAKRHIHSEVKVEKAVDVMLTVDMVIMAERNQFEAAYLLSADGDFTPAVQAVRSHGKKVYAVSPSLGAKLAAASNAYIRLPREWFDDCFRAH